MPKETRPETKTSKNNSRLEATAIEYMVCLTWHRGVEKELRRGPSPVPTGTRFHGSGASARQIERTRRKTIRTVNLPRAPRPARCRRSRCRSRHRLQVDYYSIS